jgi:arylformamidase
MQKRVRLDFEVDFKNGGSLRGQDVPAELGGEQPSDEELARALLKDMQLLPVREVRVRKKERSAEAHANQGQAGLVDLSHTVYDGLVTYKGLPAPVICDYLSREASREHYAPGTEFQIGKIEMIANTGTYVDCPFHRYADGKDLSEVGLDSFAELEGVLLRADYRKGLAVDVEAFQGLEVRGKAVLVHTGWAERWDTEAYFEAHPFLTERAAVHLRDQGARLVGIDSLNIDDTRQKDRPVHSTLLRAEVLVVEHLCHLEAVPEQGFRFSAIPPKFKGVGTFPMRAFARLG